MVGGQITEPQAIGPLCAELRKTGSLVGIFQMQLQGARLQRSLKVRKPVRQFRVGTGFRSPPSVAKEQDKNHECCSESHANQPAEPVEGSWIFLRIKFGFAI